MCYVSSPFVGSLLERDGLKGYRSRNGVADVPVECVFFMFAQEKRSRDSNTGKGGGAQSENWYLIKYSGKNRFFAR